MERRPGPLRLTSGPKQVFLDDLLIADNRGVVRTFWPSRKFDGNPVSEGVDAETYLFHDENLGKYRAITGGSYGESLDGIRWDWPLMDVARTPDGQKTNLLFIGAGLGRRECPLAATQVA